MGLLPRPSIHHCRTVTGFSYPLMAAPPLLELRNATLRYANGPLVLQDVDLQLYSGEVLGIVGENGSGKSSLIKILTGSVEPEAGTKLTIHSANVGLPTNPRSLFELGVGVVHQHPGVDPGLSVLENVRLGAYSQRMFGRIHWREERQAVAHEFERLGIPIDPRLPLADLPLDLHVIVALVRALSRVTVASGRGALLLDEPTAMLERRSTDRLFSVVREVARAGNGVVLITHRLPEILANTDRVVVLRDGVVVGSFTTASMSERRLVEHMTGTPLRLPAQPSASEAVAPSEFSVENLVGAAVRGISFQVHLNEIIGITGLPGDGFDEIPYLLTGAHRAEEGTMSLGSKQLALKHMTPRRARALGIALIPADRSRHALAMELTCRENFTQPRLRKMKSHGYISRRAETTDAYSGMVASLVSPPEPGLPPSALSGGNQQKLVLGKWLETEPRVVIAHEPTQGVDVAAKQQIFQRLRQEASRTIVVIASLEYEDLAEVCDRVLVVREGKVSAVVSGASLTGDRLLELSLLS